MKRMWLVLCITLLAGPFSSFSQDLGGWKFGYGDWKAADGRLVQASTKAGMAMANLAIPQSGVVQYEFEARYIDGLQDSYGGFGIHISVDKPLGRKSWGSGSSYLLWLTYDPRVYGGSGLYAQAYRSTSHSVMGLMHDGRAYEIPAGLFQDVDVNRLDKYYLPVRIVVNVDNGDLKVYDPLREGYYYRFSLGSPLGKGAYIGLRTNSLAGSFSNIKVTKLQ